MASEGRQERLIAALAPGGEYVFVARGSEIARIDREGRMQAWPVESLVELLEASPDGVHCAYFAGENFFVTNMESVLWSRRINTDRAAAHLIRFSPSGDFVATLDDYDGRYRTRLIELPSGIAHEIGQSLVATLWNRDLTHFTIVPAGDLNRFTGNDGFQVLHRNNLPCHPVDTADVDERLHRLLIDPQDSLAVGLSEQGIWWRRLMGWKKIDLPSDLQLRGPWHDFQAVNGIALVVGRAGKGAVLVRPGDGVVWRTGETVESAQLVPGRALFRLDHGEVIVVSADGKRLIRWLPPAGGITLACAHAARDIVVAWTDAEDGRFRLQRLFVPRPDLRM